MGLRDHAAAAKFESQDETASNTTASNTTARTTTMNTPSRPVAVNEKAPQKVTVSCRIVYPNLAEPRPADAEIDAGKYTVMVLIPKTDTAAIDAIEAAIEYAASKKFAKVRPRNMLMPLKDGDEKLDKAGEPVEWYQGNYYLNLKSNNPPRMIDPCKNFITDPSFIKGGDYARVRIAFAGYDTAGNKGVGSYVDVLQFVRAGDPLGNVDTLDDFDEEMDDIAA